MVGLVKKWAHHSVFRGVSGLSWILHESTRALNNTSLTQPQHRETSSWDVRTKHVTYETVPTLDHVKGLAVYGPGATLFTLGRSNTAQQFDLNSPPVLVANVQHPANLLPPSPPVSIEEQKKQSATAPRAAPELSSLPINLDISESDEDHMSPLARIAKEMDKLEQERASPGIDRADTLSPASSRSHTSASSTNSRSSAGSRPYYRKISSVISRGGQSEATTISVGSSLHSIREPSLGSSRDSLSLSSISSQSNATHRSRPRGSRLRQEVLRSPDEAKVIDIFKFTKSRLSDIPYSHPKVLDHSCLTNDDLRRQMLSTIFGWDGEAEALIRDEISRHPLGSPNRLLLAKWLGDIDTDIMASSSESMTSSDWMLLALSGIGGQASQTKVARAYVQRLLEKGDVHTAATIMVGMGDQNDAIEIYVSHKRYMEALILTCLVFPNHWQRQAELVRKWGEWAVQHGQQQLAIRCFSCTGTESSEPWFSPTAQAATFSRTSIIPEVLSPPLSPPGPRGPQRSIAKTSALKLITSFGDKTAKSKFFGLGEDERTPVGGGGGVTPIAESALSPSGDTAHTALLRPGHRSAYHTPASARTATPGGFSRQRLPSIGETPSDVLPRRKLEPTKLPTPVDSGSERERNERIRAHERNISQPETMQLSSAKYSAPTTRAATASPMMEKSKSKVSNPLPSPSPESFTAVKQDARTRNGSRDRKPDGLQIQWPPMESILTGDYMTSPDLSITSSRHRAPRSVAGSLASYSSAPSNRSPMASERSYRTTGTSGNPSPVITGRSLDQYISSLESAQYHSEKQRVRHASRDRHKHDKAGRGRSGSRNAKAREPSEDRGRTAARYIKPAKRSPTSPLPMSPEDLRDLGAVGYGDETFKLNAGDFSSVKEGAQLKRRPSKSSSRIRHASPEPAPLSFANSKPSSRTASRSRRRSPGSRLVLSDARGRNKSRDGSVIRSPSSPLPMSAQAKYYQADDDEDETDLKRAREEHKRFRSRQRSTSRLRERETSAVRATSPDRRRQRDLSSSRRPAERDNSRAGKEPSAHSKRERREPSHTRAASERQAGDLNQIKDERTLKKEQAARELEERRKSLAGRPSVPPIVHPEELARLSPMSYQPISPPEFARSSTYPSGIQPQVQQSRSQTTSPIQTTPDHLQDTSASGYGVQIGLPATPRAMRHPKYDPEGRDIPDVPQIPEKYDSTQAPSWGSLNANSYNDAFESLAPLPKSTYQVSPRRIPPPRSASAPILEKAPVPNSPQPLPAALPTHPAFQAALPPSSRRRAAESNSSRAAAISSTRKINPGESQPGTLGYETRNNNPAYSIGNQTIMSGIEETIEANEQPLNPSNNSLTPPAPPPPPSPPILRELQHLAKPPPPPPAPLQRPNNPNTNSVVSGISSQGSGVIEIVMDDEEEKNKGPNSAVDVPAPPQAPFARESKISHSRGRSENDNSISGRFSRAAERLRSASRGRNTTSPGFDKSRSPIESSPYESVPPLGQWGGSRSASNTPVVPNSSGFILTERHPREVKAAMNQADGGMI